MYYKVLWTWWNFGEWPWINMLRVCLTLKGFFLLTSLGSKLISLEISPPESTETNEAYKRILRYFWKFPWLSPGVIVGKYPKCHCGYPKKILEKLQTTQLMCCWYPRWGESLWFPTIHEDARPEGDGSSKKDLGSIVKQLMKQTDLMKTSS